MQHSFVTQSNDGIDSHGATRGNVGSQQRDKRKKHGDAHKGQRVGSANAKKERGHEASDRQRRGNADDHAESSHACTFAQNQTQNVATLATKRHANADFLGAARDGESHNSVDTDGGKSESGGGEESHKKKQKTAIREPAAHFLREG